MMLRMDEGRSKNCPIQVCSPQEEREILQISYGKYTARKCESRCHSSKK